jgi:epoxyqueuosine reductase QueG
MVTKLKAAAIAAGADLVGVADLEPFKAERQTLSAAFMRPFTRAVSLAIRLDDAVIDAIVQAPTTDYARHYRGVNARLDRASSQLADWIKGRGYAAAALPASSIVDEKNLLGGISHRAAARMAGIGWQGKSLLIVSPQFGPRIRLTTLLTNLPCRVDMPLKNRCGSCAACATACPAAAIKNVRTSDRYATRDEALYLERCARQTMLFKQQREIGASICGVCVAVCPFGTR